MAKVPSRKKPAKVPQPEAAQVKAVERLMAVGDYTQAAERARILVERFPDYGGVWRLLVDALIRGKDHAAAVLAAYQWVERRPNSVPALEALFPLAVEGAHLFLAEDIAARARTLGVVTPGFPMDVATRDGLRLQPQGNLATPEVMTRFDIGKMHLNAHDFAGAARELDGVAITPARNNRALALFHLGCIDAALAAFLDAWQADPDNLLALGRALRLRLYRGDETGARGLAVPLAQSEARRIEDAHAQTLALLMIREDQAAWDAFERSSKIASVGEDVGPMKAHWLHQGACAASRLGRGDQARALWAQALCLDPGLSAAKANLGALGKGGMHPAYPELFDQGQVLPIGWIRGLSAAGEAGVGPELDALVASDAYVEAIYLGGDEPLRHLAAMLLERRLNGQVTDESQAKTRGKTRAGTESGGQRRAATILRDLARLPIGTSQDRLGLLRALRDRHLIAEDEAVPFWDGTALSEVQVVGTEVYRDPMPSDLPEDLKAMVHEAVLLHQEGRLDEAEAWINTILGRVPDHPIALGNLAAIRAAQGRGKESREVLRRVIAAHPDYLIARCNLATFLIQDRALDEAGDLLAGLARRPRLHIEEIFSLYGAMAMLNRARGEHAAADALMASLEGMTQDEDDERLLALAKCRAERVTATGRILGVLRKILNFPG